MALLDRQKITAGSDPNSATVVRQLSEKFWLNDARALLMLNKMGGPNGGESKFSLRGISALKYEWLEDGNIPRAFTLAGAVSEPSSTGTDVNGNATYANETWSVSNYDALRPGHVLYMPLPSTADPETDTPEHVLVVSQTESTVVVRRGFAGTPVYAYDNGSAFEILTHASNEAGEFTASYNVRRAVKENYWQTFTTGIQRTKMSTYMDHYGNVNEYERQMVKIMGGNLNGRSIPGEIWTDLEMAVLYGVGQAGGGNGESTFNGLNASAIGINQAVTTTLDFDYIQDSIETLLGYGADISRLEIITSPSIQRIISTWTDGTVQVDRTDTQVGRRVESIMTDWGAIPVAWHRFIRANELYILDFSTMGVLEGWEFTETEMAQTSSLVRSWMIDGCYGFAVGAPKHNMRIQYNMTGYNPRIVDPTFTEVSFTAPGNPGTAT